MNMRNPVLYYFIHIYVVLLDEDDSTAMPLVREHYVTTVYHVVDSAVPNTEFSLYV